VKEGTVRQSHQHVQQRHSADDDVEYGGKPGACAARKCQGNRLHQDHQHYSATSIADGQALDLFGKGTTRTISDIAEQPPH
jgi:hypothetical protein